ncbi:MAG: EF-hand domain-containing protein [Candidatus Omnitrophica bacterium]|jgi:Ca2+-binding EF-hand superfamily protein|nr:EF-hand domain-containing protein [Candidatus Omnitrophota bacterium]
MKIGEKLIVFGCFILLGCFNIFAQQIDMPAASEQFQKMDIDKDGFLTPDEMQIRQVARFNELDKDKNDVLDQEELKEDEKRTFEKADKDNDTKISRQEAFTQFNDYFNKMDSDKDNKISENEFKECWPVEINF